MTYTEEEEELEDLAEEAGYRETLAALETQAQRYKDLFGELPSGNLTPTGIQDQIIKELKRRDLRPYKL